jgi:hypothetical protein
LWNFLGKGEGEFDENYKPFFSMTHVQFCLEEFCSWLQTGGLHASSDVPQAFHQIAQTFVSISKHTHTQQTKLLQENWKKRHHASSPSITIVGFPEINFLKPPQTTGTPTHNLLIPLSQTVEFLVVLAYKENLQVQGFKGLGFKELHR